MFFMVLTIGLIIVMGILAITIWQMQLLYKTLILGLIATMAILYLLIMVATVTL